MEQSGQADKTLIIDASAILAIYLKEPKALRIAETINRHPHCLMSALTAKEILIKLLGRRILSSDVFLDDMQTFGIRLIDIDTRQAVLAAEARNRYPLNLGDCFVYALAFMRDATVLTLDSDFKKCDIAVFIPD